MSLVLAPGLIAYVPVAAAGEVSITVNAPDRVVPGSSFTATVNISQVVDLNAVQYEIMFDPLVLRLDDVTPGKVGSVSMPVQRTLVSPGRYGVLQFLWFNKVSGAGYLALLHFSVVGSAGGSSTINLDKAVLSDWQAQAIPAAWIGDSVSIGSVESPGAGLPTTTAVPSSLQLETTGAPATEGNISQSAGNESSADSGDTVSAEPDGEEVTAAASPSSKAETIPSSKAPPLSSSKVKAEAPLSLEAASAKPVIWPVLWSVVAGVLVAGLLIFLQVRRRHYLLKK